MSIFKRKICCFISAIALIFNLSASMQTAAFATENKYKTSGNNESILRYGSGYITGYNVNLRPSYGLNNTPIGFVNYPDTFDVYDTIPQPADGYVWINVRMTSGPYSGRQGWVARSYTSW